MQSEEQDEFVVNSLKNFAAQPFSTDDDSVFKVDVSQTWMKAPTLNINVPANCEPMPIFNFTGRLCSAHAVEKFMSPF